ncbi:hypothetical protein RhiirA4_474192 [Rhizophagus irregularis]|uniref:Uncharacterized protein n=1 Tax=Rhizophagus irregularis TaxID=588596 RepID=A0A2I1H833_9GLOM|nr:hypothetical protein RhiirA4_474192 [Rhizophagus irregularis]
MVLKSNRKVIEKDLPKHYSTIFAIRHLIDGDTDKRFLRSYEGFSALKKSTCEKLFNDWFVTEDKLFDKNDYNDKITIDDHFMTKLSISYNELDLHAALINSSIIWYEMASCVTENTFGNKENICLKLGDVVTIQDEEYSELFAIIQLIFHHKLNNNTGMVEQRVNEEDLWIKNEFYFTAV